MDVVSEIESKKNEFRSHTRRIADMHVVIFHELTLQREREEMQSSSHAKTLLLGIFIYN